jgi:hypothetical protein
MTIDGRLEEHGSGAQENDVQRRPGEIEVVAPAALPGPAATSPLNPIAVK